MEIEAGEVLFLDTNILLTATDESRRYHQSATRLVASHRRSGFNLGINGQVIREYLVVATRPLDANGLGLKPTDALKNTEAFRSRIVYFDETEAVSNELRRLVKAYGLSGTRIHDTNIVATMLTHGLSILITENKRDFSVFSDLKTIDLSEISQYMSADP